MEKLTKEQMKHIRSKSDQKTELTEIVEKHKFNIKTIIKNFYEIIKIQNY